MRLYFAIFSLFCGSLYGQQAPGQPFPLTDDEAVAAINRILQHETRLEPMLQQLHPAEWVTKGAADTYQEQFASVNRQIRAVEADMTDLAQHPAQMTDCMKALFRAQGFHGILESLLGGLRRYQNPALADLIESVAAEDGADIERLETWVLQLASDKDAQFSLVDREAQRCRTNLSTEPSRRK